MKLENIVADSGAFLRNANLQELAGTVYTCREVISEIRDKETRKRLAVLPYQLKFKSPSPKHVQKIVEISKQTGDYPSLSATDIQVLALTYQLTCELDRDPVGENKQLARDSVQFGGSLKNDLSLPGFFMPSDGDKGAEICEDVHGDVENDDDVAKDEEDFSKDEEDFSKDEEDFSTNEEDLLYKEKEEEAPQESKEVDAITENLEEINIVDERRDNDAADDDNAGWITPATLRQMKESSAEEATEAAAKKKVACLTTDFAMQNVLLKMHMGVVSVDGVVVTTTRSYILRCHACFTTTKIMTKVFCPKCGNKTLKRVPVQIQEDGTMKMFLSRNPKVLNPRGLRYSLPAPQGGKHARNPILCEDQNRPHDRPSRKALLKTDVWGEDYDAMTSPFVENEINSKSFRLGVSSKAGRGRQNPNAVGQKFVKRR